MNRTRASTLVVLLLLGCTRQPSSGPGNRSDVQAPTIPSDVRVTATTASSVSLSWAASTDDVAVTSYEVSGGAAALSTPQTSATLSALASSTSYWFTVRARDAAGNLSGTSAPVGATTQSSGGSTSGGTDLPVPSSSGSSSGASSGSSSGNSSGSSSGSSSGATRHQGPYPTAAASTCGSWSLTENVCCARYCRNDLKSESCAGCGGNDAPDCVTVDAKACMSGEWPEVQAVGASEAWHYSRSTHFGLTSGGACGFGFYGLCTTAFRFTDPTLSASCDAFCKAYPVLCADPAGTTLRGNFAAPQGNYYTQFWPSLPGDRDNYLSCGECFEVLRTHKDGTDYQPGEAGYAPPITLQLIDSCPCSANSKWCCGSGRDHCAEVSDFKYGCQLPPAPPPPLDHDPVPGESIHLDLSDIAMARLQTGDANGNMVDGVIPTRYRRVPCPVVGNVYVWLRSGAGPYWFALTVVNVSGPGSVVKVEAQLASGGWVALLRDPNYTTSRPQERYGSWVVPQGAGPFALPMSLRITSAAGAVLTASGAVKAWASPDAAMAESYYIDTGLQF